MRIVILCLTALAGCSGDGGEGPADAGGACDAVPVDYCGLCGDATCVQYDTQHGFSSCEDFTLCVETDLGCAPGTCTTECESALCAPGGPDFTCAPATGRYTCTRP
jgi:hypothetical protein